MFRLSGFCCKATIYPGSSLLVSSPQSYRRHCLLSFSPDCQPSKIKFSTCRLCIFFFVFFFQSTEVHTRECHVKTETHRGGKWPYEAGGWDWSFVTMNQGTPGVTRSWKRNVRILPREFRERLAPLPCWIQTSSLWNSEGIHFPVSPHPVCDSLLQQPKETGTSGMNVKWKKKRVMVKCWIKYSRYSIFKMSLYVEN